MHKWVLISLMVDPSCLADLCGCGSRWTWVAGIPEMLTPLSPTDCAIEPVPYCCCGAAARGPDGAREVRIGMPTGQGQAQL